MIGEKFVFSGTEYVIKKLLGKGKSAYSWLCENSIEKVVLKQIHDEPCSYYQFQDKFRSELNAYRQLIKMQILAPEMLGFDEDKRWIFKEYIHGKTAAELIAADKIEHQHFTQLLSMAKRAKSAGFNLDFFPTNFVLGCKILYYIDYELNLYEDAWNLQNWGLFYWVNNKGMKQFLETGDALHINADLEKGIPHKDGFAQQVAAMLQIVG